MMAVTVVDRLEPVDVDQKQAHRHRGATGPALASHVEYRGKTTTVWKIPVSGSIWARRRRSRCGRGPSPREMRCCRAPPASSREGARQPADLVAACIDRSPRRNRRLDPRASPSTLASRSSTTRAEQASVTKATAAADIRQQQRDRQEQAAIDDRVDVHQRDVVPAEPVEIADADQRLGGRRSS